MLPEPQNATMLAVTPDLCHFRSLGAECNYAIRFESEADAERFVDDLAEEVARRLNKAGVSGRGITFKVMRRQVRRCSRFRGF